MRTARIPETVFRLGLSPQALALYGVFLLHRNKRTGTAWPARETMLQLSGVGVNGLTDRLEELKEIGLIERTRKRPNNVNEYRVNLPEECAEPESRNRESDPKSRITKSCLPESRNRDSGTHETVSVTILKNHLEEPPSRAARSVSVRDAVLPFKSEAFSTAWASWQNYHRERRRPLASATIKAQLKLLESLGEPKALAAIEKSIANGWTGLFEPKNASATPTGKFKTCSAGRD